MKKTIVLGNRTIEFDYVIKRVKNINLRIKSDGSVFISANKKVGFKEIEAFMRAKSQFITNALEKFENAPKTEKIQYYSEHEIKDVILDICKKIYLVFEKRGIEYPVIKFRKMVSRWGSCNHVKGILTFNTSLMFTPYECIEYVVYHEFCHFLQPNHSKEFYNELSKVCPKYKILKNKLKNIPTR